MQAYLFQGSYHLLKTVAQPSRHGQATEEAALSRPADAAERKAGEAIVLGKGVAGGLTGAGCSYHCADLEASYYDNNVLYFDKLPY